MFQEKVNILEAIANAGDITLVGDRKRVTVIRQYPYGTEMHDIDLTDIKVMESPYYYLQQNDVVYVEPNKVKAGQREINQNRTIGTFASILSVMVSLAVLIFK